MSYLALYRKYRSTTFDEVYGQEAIVKTLKNALKENKIAHAYLFSGPRGTGKTSIARLFAKALNCENNDGNICNNCSNCKEIAQGISPDVIEIDAASNSGVDQVRDLIEKVKYAPTKSKYKVYIIDEVHMMSNSAFNALLKTLEEPPSYVVFILCTTELYKVLPTIVSRCQRYEFKKISDEELTRLLKDVLKKENINYEEKAISEIVELSNGGARDALSMLDQVISFNSEFIHSSDIEQLFGLTTKEEKLSIFNLIYQKDYKNLVNIFNNLIDKNIDLGRLINELLNSLKETLIDIKINGNSTDLTVSTLKKEFNEEEILNMIDVFLSLLKELKITNNPTLLVELSLLKLIENKSIKVEKVIERVEIKEPATSIKVQETIKEKPKTEKDEIIEPTKTTSLFKENGEKSHLVLDDLVKLAVLSNKEAKKEVLIKWKTLSSYKNPDLDPFINLLSEGLPFLYGENFLVLLYKFNDKSDLINIKENQNYLSKIVKNLLGKDLRIYAIDRNESSDLLSKYRNLEELDKLPHKNDISFNDIKF